MEIQTIQRLVQDATHAEHVPAIIVNKAQKGFIVPAQISMPE
jgi:hypothetical protein